MRCEWVQARAPPQVVASRGGDNSTGGDGRRGGRGNQGSHRRGRHGSNGVVTLSDAGGASFPAELVDVLQPVGTSKADARYFACVDFRKLGSEPAFYSTVYWLDPKTKLVTAGRVTNVRTGGSKAATEPHCDIGGIAFDIVD